MNANLIVLWLLLSSIAFAVSPGAFSQTPAPSTPVTLQICNNLSVLYAPYVFGIEKGIFAKYGIDLKILEGTGKGCLKQFTAVKEGKVRFGISDPLPLISHGNASDGLKFIIGIYQSSAYSYVSLPGNKIRTPSDFKGKKVGVLQSGNDKQLLPVVLKANGLTLADVTVVEIPSIQEKIGFLTSGKVDVVTHTLSGAVGWQKHSKTPLSIMRVESYGVAIPGQGIYVSTQFLEKASDRELNCRMASAISESWNLAGKDPDGTIKALFKVAPAVEAGDAAIAKEAFMRSYSLTQLRSSLGKPTGFIFSEDWTRLLKTLKELKLLETVHDFEHYVDIDAMKCLK